MTRALFLLLAALAGCTTRPAPHHPRPALPLPGAVAERYALPGPVTERVLTEVSPAGASARILRGRLASGGELAEITFIRAPGDGNAPFVLLLPILAGGDVLMWHLAQSLGDHGFHVGWTRRVSSAMRPGNDMHELEELFRRTVIHNRMLLAWAREREDVDPDRTAVLGLSMGGMLGCAILAVEPGLRAGALCLAGGDFPDLVSVSAERRLRLWRRWSRSGRGLGGGPLREEIARSAVSDPMLLGPYVATERVFLVASLFDEVVPWRNQQLLWESLGRPRRTVLPLGHYSAALAIGPALDETAEFFVHRFAEGPAKGDTRGCTP